MPTHCEPELPLESATQPTNFDGEEKGERAGLLANDCLFLSTRSSREKGEYMDSGGGPCRKKGGVYIELQKREGSGAPHHKDASYCFSGANFTLDSKRYRGGEVIIGRRSPGGPPKKNRKKFSLDEGFKPCPARDAKNGRDGRVTAEGRDFKFGTSRQHGNSEFKYILWKRMIPTVPKKGTGGEQLTITPLKGKRAEQDFTSSRLLNRTGVRGKRRFM